MDDRDRLAKHAAEPRWPWDHRDSLYPRERPWWQREEPRSRLERSDASRVWRGLMILALLPFAFLWGAYSAVTRKGRD